MPTCRRICLLALAGLLLPSGAYACLWDHDTLLQERSRFPSALELITGKYFRHSPEFYRWRIADRLTKLRAEPDNLAYLDDLAVAYDKTGEHQRAIDTMLQAAAKRPGQYETEANLGTFYIHAEQLENGLEHIDRALAINPNAHFGREKYQRLLVEYVLACREGDTIPLPHDQISEASCALLHEGMPRRDVEAVLGGPPGAYTNDERDWSMGMLHNGVRGITHTREVWVGDDGGIRIDFDQDGRVAVWQWCPRHWILWDRMRGWVGW